MQKILLFCLLLATSYNLSSQRLLQNYMTPDGDIFAIESDANYVYIGGQFNNVGYPSDGLGVVTENSTVPKSNFPTFSGRVNVIISDGNGGYYVGGAFSERLVKIKSDGSIDETFDLNPSSNVTMLKIIGNYLYIGGDFTLIDGISKWRLARMDLNTNSIDPNWGVNFNSTVFDIILDGNFAYVGGAFTTVDGQNLRAFAKLNANDGSLVNGFDIDINNNITQIEVLGNELLIAGRFGVIQGVFMSGLVRVDKTTGLLNQSWDVDLNGSVNEFSISGNDLYLAGSFSTIGSHSTDKVGKINLSDATPDLNFSFDTVNDCYALAIKNNYLYVGGSFTFFESDIYENMYAVRIDLTTNQVDESWNINPQATVFDILLDANMIFLVGDFDFLQTKRERNLARIDKSTGFIDQNWQPECNGSVFSIILDGNDVFVGGFFNSIGGVSNAGIAKLNTSDGMAVPGFSSGFSSGTDIYELKVVGDHLYVGGDLFDYDRRHRRGLIRVDKNTGVLDNSWNSNINSEVRDFEFKDNKIYVVGDFDWVGSFTGFSCKVTINDDTPDANFARVDAPGLTGGEAREVISDGNGGYYFVGEFSEINNTSTEYIAHVLQDGTVDNNFNPPSFNDLIRGVKMDGDYLYVFGDFTQVDGLSNTYRLCKLNKTTGALLTDFDPNPNSRVHSILLDGDNLYCSGEFTFIDGQSRSRFAKLNKNDATLDPIWNPNANNYCNDMILDGNEIIIAGLFTDLNGTSRNRIAKVDKVTGAVDQNFDPNCNNTIYDIDLFNQHLYLFGSFTNVDNTSVNRTCRIDKTTGDIDNTWLPDVGFGTIFSGKVVGNDVIIGGDFSSVSGVERNKIAKLDATTAALDMSWNPNANPGVNFDVFNLFNVGNDIIISGSCPNYGGTERNNAVKLNELDGSIDPAWNPNPDNEVYAIAVNSVAILGGQFDDIQNTGIAHLCKTNLTDGTVDQTWNPAPNNYINDCEILNNTVFVCGNYSASDDNFSIANSSRDLVTKLDLSSGEVVECWNADYNFPLFGQVGLELDLFNNNEIFISSTVVSIDGINAGLRGYPSELFPPNIDGEVQNITNNRFDFVTYIQNDGGADITESGITCSFNPNPIVDDPGSLTIRTNPLVSSGNFNTPFENMQPEQQKFIKGFARNCKGLSYGPERELWIHSNPFQTPPSNFQGESNTPNSVDISWIPATLPPIGASDGRYAILYAPTPDVPTADFNDGFDIQNIGPNTVLVSDNIPYTQNSTTITGLESDTEYKFLLVPYTSNGTHIETNNWDDGFTMDFKTIKDEPSNHLDRLDLFSFDDGANTAIINLIDQVIPPNNGNTQADGYLIKASIEDNIVAPEDGTPEADATLVKNVTFGTNQVTFTNLPESEEYYFEAYPYTNSDDKINYKTDGDVASLKVLAGQINIPITTGWNIVSSNIDPIDNDIEIIFNAIEDDILLVKNGSGQIYAPAFGINDIISWNVLQGYQVYATAATNLNIQGTQMVPENSPINLPIGWSIVSFLRSSSSTTDDAFATLTDNSNLLLAKNSTGQIYAPDFGIDDIINVNPTEGYQVYLTASDILIYPANGGGGKVSNYNAKVTIPKSLIPSSSRTGSEMTIIIETDQENQTEVGVYDSNNSLIGSGVVNNGKVGVTVWGDDSYTDYKDGAIENESLTIKSLSDNELKIMTTNIYSLDGNNTEDELIFKSGSIILAKSNIESESRNIIISPQPVRDKLTLQMTNINGSKKIEIRNIRGELIYSITTNSNVIDINTSELLIGSYNITIINKEKIYNDRFIKIK